MAAWVRNESVAEFMVRRKRLEAIACPADSEIPFFNEHMEIANQHGMDYGKLWSSSSACGMAAHISSSSRSLRDCISSYLIGACLFALAGHSSSGTAQTPVSSHEADTRPVLLYSPMSNLERSEMQMLGRAKVSIDVAMYSFTDMELAEELGRLAWSGVRVRVYRDSAKYEQESQRGISTTEILLAAGVEVEVKASRDLMHLKSYAIDGALLRTGSANWSPTGLKRQDNDLRYEVDPVLARQFDTRFAEMWDRPGNLVPTSAR